MRIKFNRAKKKLAILWFTFAGIIFLLMFTQTLTNNFENKINEAWGWIFPMVLPTLSLIITIFGFDIKQKPNSDFWIDKFYYKMSLYISLFYLLMIFLILLSEPILNTSIIKTMQKSSIYLGPMQAIVSAAVGIFYIKKEE